MEVEMSNPSDILPPREEWPPAIRPAIQGKRLTLPEDEPRAVTKSVGSAPGKKAIPRTIESLIDTKLSAFATTVQKQMEEMGAALIKQLAPRVSSSGAQENTSRTPTQVDGTKKRPVPGEGTRGESLTRRGKTKSQKPVASTSSAPPTVVKQSITAEKRPTRNEASSSRKENIPSETTTARPPEKWTQVVGRKAAKKKTAEAPRLMAPSSSASTDAKKKEKGETRKCSQHARNEIQIQGTEQEENKKESPAYFGNRSFVSQ
ncbi:histone H1A-like [Cardiocondyla obscurior]|uniref:histone H1A-like n=1 Tax=Cardiocondyla obscurior TaxID=286306 RepID=UPI003965694D